MPNRLDRRTLIASGVAAAGLVLTEPAFAAPTRRKPNIIIVLADDLGYGDLGSYGAKAIATPRLDRMAREGVRLTDFYAAANLCTPSRAGLLTGRYPIRTGLAHQVIQASDTNGLPPAEVTIAEALKPDYATMLIGKWHLGHVAPFWPPTGQGFDRFFGLPYSHDMKPIGLYSAEPGIELTREDVNPQKLTERFFARTIRFIQNNRDRPFFALLALTAPHQPLNPNPPHAGHSRAADYGDVVEEIDAGVGALLDRVKALGLDNDTIIIVTSDNGPWFQGSTGPLRDRKGGSGWDGGYRVPFIVRAPGRLPAGKVSNAIGMGIDIMPTVLAMAGLPPPAGVAIDGRDLNAVFTRGAPSPHEELILFNNERVAAIRTQRWKLVERVQYRSYDLPLDKLGAWMLFDTERDVGENYSVSNREPAMLADMKARFKRAQATFEPIGLKQQPDILPPGL
jgi:arylsulfatase A